MADVTIGELPSLNTMEADTLMPVEHDGEAKSMAGSVLQSYVYGLVQDDVETISEIIAVGPAGVSPTLSANKVGGTTTVSYTDVDHPTSTVLATISDGTNGVTPTLSSSKTGKTTTIYYTDADHPTSTVLATLQDGADGTGVGDMLKSTYDQDNDGVVDNAEKLGGELPSYYQPAITANGVLQGNGSGTITAKTVDTAPSSNGTNLITSGAVYNAVKRTDAIDAANTSYSTKMARAIYATTTDLTAGSSSLTSGVICLVYEA